MPFMEGPYSPDVAEEMDKSRDPVGQYTAVLTLASVFKGIDIEEEKLRVEIDNEKLLEFSMVQLAIFATVVRCT